MGVCLQTTPCVPRRRSPYDAVVLDTPAPASREHSGIPVAEIVSALSFALDLTENAVPGHALRTCLIGMRLAQTLGLGDADRSSLFYALLLKDVGCTSDVTRLHEAEIHGGSKLQTAEMPPDSVERATMRCSTASAQQANSRNITSRRCNRGASILLGVGLPRTAAEAVRHLNEHWDGSGYPDQLQGKQIPILSRIALLAQHLDTVASSRGIRVALDSLREGSGSWFDPALVCMAALLHRTGLLRISTKDADCRKAVLDLEPGQRLVASDTQIDAICDSFADVVDVKSSFTATHSRGVNEAAMRIAGELQLSTERRNLVWRASLLHDLGKLRVPNSILDKPGELTQEEFAVIREHPGLTRDILSRVKLFGRLAKVAGQHHERLDGSGYPDRLTAEQLSLESRLIAVADVYGALSENRPYRKGMPFTKVRQILANEALQRLDRTCFEALLSSLERDGLSA